MLEDDGWRLVRTTGSHRQFQDESKARTVTVAARRVWDLPPATLNSILKQAGFKEMSMESMVVVEKSETALEPTRPTFRAASRLERLVKRGWSWFAKRLNFMSQVSEKPERPYRLQPPLPNVASCTSPPNAWLQPPRTVTLLYFRWRYPPVAARAAERQGR